MTIEIVDLPIKIFGKAINQLVKSDGIGWDSGILNGWIVCTGTYEKLS